MEANCNRDRRNGGLYLPVGKFRSDIPGEWERNKVSYQLRIDMEKAKDNSYKIFRDYLTNIEFNKPKK